MPVPVIWVYLTGWSNGDGAANFRDDVYGLDTVGDAIASAASEAPVSTAPRSSSPRPTVGRLAGLLTRAARRDRRAAAGAGAVGGGSPRSPGLRSRNRMRALSATAPPRRRSNSAHRGSPAHFVRARLEGDRLRMNPPLYPASSSSRCRTASTRSANCMRSRRAAPSWAIVAGVCIERRPDARTTALDVEALDRLRLRIQGPAA